MNSNLCPQCGNELKENDKVCLKCGYVIINATQNNVVSNEENSVFSNNSNPVFVFNNDSKPKKSFVKVLTLGIAIGVIAGGTAGVFLTKTISSTNTNTYNKQQEISEASNKQDASKTNDKQDNTKSEIVTGEMPKNTSEMAASGDPLITSDDIGVLDVSLTDYQTYKEVVFKLQNNSDYDLSSLTLNFAELDSEENVLSANAANLSVACPAGKSFTVKCIITNKDCMLLKGSSFYYDCNNDHNVQEVVLNDALIEKTTVALD